jgi:phosphohistidine phosphatase
MRLYFFRHGPAESRAAWAGEDSERPLTPEGAAVTREASRAMRSLGLGVTAIVPSPYARARETALIAANELGLQDALSTDSRLEPGFDEGDLREVLAGRAEHERLLLVGHEPDFSSTIAAITGGGRVTMKKAGLARIDVGGADDLSGELVWLAPPKLLAR